MVRSRASGPARFFSLTMKYNPKIVIAYFTQCGLPKPVMEYEFHPTRKWRFDFAWIRQMIALEVEGGTFIAGRHSRGEGMRADMEKYNAAATLGWRVLRVMPENLSMLDTVKMLAESLGKETL